MIRFRTGSSDSFRSGKKNRGSRIRVSCRIYKSHPVKYLIRLANRLYHRHLIRQFRMRFRNCHKRLRSQHW
ncbi:hypothetical protein [Niabella beijingensis]|uniref:hypothetical protein n=1 Tax=Niabella beijingensis TaxID=2872700 RepID=UPI001CBDD8E4|nr:hypothetical protein [Niabella beijingensis]MBZ4190848.1 hypothetical protein [Niabella beijingensis]